MDVKQKLRLRYGLLLALALVLILGGLVCLPLVMDAVYHLVINTMMQLDPSSPLFAEWMTPDLPMFQSYYVFDIQNPEEFRQGAKPRVIERGPYVYRLAFDRLNLTFYDNGTLSFYPQYLYEFDEEKSAGPETDTVITLNIPLVTVAFFVRNSDRYVQRAANRLMEELGEPLTLNLTIGELLWGYEEPLFELIQPIIPIPGYDQGEFGFLLLFNATTNFQYTVFDGKADQKMLNMVDNYQGKPELSWWWSDEANTIKGTDGTMYPPYRSRSDNVKLFHPGLCRYVTYEYQNDTRYRGILLYNYALAPYTYSNGTEYPPNDGFCSGDPDLCMPSGIMRQDPCRLGTPSAISNPHFFEGDSVLVDAVEGLKPQAEAHQHYIQIEPLMGMPYVLKMRLQINMVIEPVQAITEVKDVKKMAMPVLWMEQSVEADDRIVSYYNTGFVFTAYVAMIIKWTLFALGVLTLSLTLLSFARRIACPATNVSEEEKAEKIVDSTDDVACDETVSGIVFKMNAEYVQEKEPSTLDEVPALKSG